MKIRSVNPFTEEVIREFDLFSKEECKERVVTAKEGFSRWGELSISQRVHCIKKAADLLRQNNRKYSEIITEEMGKPIKESSAEIDKCAWLCDYYAQTSRSFLQDEPIKTGTRLTYVTYEPLGIILGIMPWNFPFWQVFRFAIPTLVAGNVCLLKHASNVSLAALEVQELFRNAGFPSGVFQTLLANSDTVSQLIEQDDVDGVSLTGSVQAGSQVGRVAGKKIKKTVLELGGSDPFLVFDDADLDKAAQVAIRSRMANGGQSCIAAKRIIVKDSIAETFQDKLLEHLYSLKVGNPMDEDTQIGPLAAKEFVEVLKVQLEDATEKGAWVLWGPEPPKDKGFFFQPAIVTHVNNDMRILREEVFGPLAPILIAHDEDEMIRMANDTDFGLGAAIWSKDIKKAVRMAQKIQVGFIAINDMVKSDPRLPFGGIKKSGVGRELSHYGLKEFVNIKTVVIQG